MKSSVHAILPPPLRRSLAKFGADLAVARRKRRLTITMMTERIGVSKSTYRRAEKGDPTVALAVYAMAMHVLGLGLAFAELAAAGRDEHGLLLDEGRLPRRIRPRKDPAL